MLIKNEEDYLQALEEAHNLMQGDPDPESKQGKELATLSSQIEEYEAKHFPL